MGVGIEHLHHLAPGPTPAEHEDAVTSVAWDRDGRSHARVDHLGPRCECHGFDVEHLCIGRVRLVLRFIAVNDEDDGQNVRRKKTFEETGGLPGPVLPTSLF
jgi:hypothetical protein